MNFLKKLFAPKQKSDEIKRALEAKLVDLRKPAVRLLKTAELRNSKFGGRPLVDSKSFNWPESNGKPMAFLAQIDLSEIAEQFKYDWLNDQGLLLFFYDVFEMPWGFDPKDRGKWRVIYQAFPDTLAEFPPALDGEARIKEAYIDAKRTEVLPDYDDPSVAKLNLSRKQADLYCELTEAESLQQPLHQVGGFPAPVQGNYMALEAQLASNGIYVGTPKGYKCAEAKALEEGAEDWRLLFQFDSDDGLDVMWGDCGRLYFWVRQDQSKLNHFDNCWLVLQCC